MSEQKHLKCSKCGVEAAAQAWIQIFGSLFAAQNHGEGPEFLSSFMPGAGVLKVEFCIACGSFSICKDYSPEELKELEAYAAKQKKRTQSSQKLGEQLGTILGGIFKEGPK